MRILAQLNLEIEKIHLTSSVPTNSEPFLIQGTNDLYIFSQSAHFCGGQFSQCERKKNRRPM